MSRKRAGGGLTLKFKPHFPLCLWQGEKKKKSRMGVCEIQRAAVVSIPAVLNKDDPEVLGSTELKEGCSKVASFRCSLASTPIKESFCHDNRSAASDRKHPWHMIKSDIIASRAQREGRREGGRHRAWPRTGGQKLIFLEGVTTSRNHKYLGAILGHDHFPTKESSPSLHCCRQRKFTATQLVAVNLQKK